jgi:hypothetical protein
MGTFDKGAPAHWAKSRPENMNGEDEGDLAEAPTIQSGIPDRLSFDRWDYNIPNGRYYNRFSFQRDLP